MNLPDLSDPSELAAYLVVPERTLAKWRSLGTGPKFIRMGRHVRYRRADVEAWLEDQTRTRTA